MLAYQVHFPEQVAENIINLLSDLTKSIVTLFPLTSSFCSHQAPSLEDYMQLSVMLEYNHRERQES